MAIVIDNLTATKLGINKKKPSKMHNEKTVCDGITFDSAKEAQRYAELKMLERVGLITELTRQESFVLIPAQYRNGKLVERAVIYKADFTYVDEKGDKIVEDVKGFKTKEYIIKRKLLLHIYGIQIREI